MKRMVLSMCVVLVMSTSLGVQQSDDQEAAKKLLREKYAQHVVARFKPATKTFMEKNPQANEAKILQRYIDEVATSAMNTRKKDMPLNTIGEELFDALSYTPCDPSRLDWILTGKEPDPNTICCQPVCSHGFSLALEQIESEIQKK